MISNLTIEERVGRLEELIFLMFGTLNVEEVKETLKKEYEEIKQLEEEIKKGVK